MEVQIKKIDPIAKIPKVALEGDAGMDLFSVEDVNLKSGERIFCRTGIAVKIPLGYVGLIWDKSGIARDYGIKTIGGVFDSNYTGEWFIGLVNLGQKDYKIVKGQKIAQALIQEVIKPKIKEVDKFPKTNRGADGFGSTGR
ncbi:MAG: dUTP diphosphatase [Patescibacteria group bacterium]|nr:dUTP diphosphatase [Patescibacteria group bacterium]